MRRETRKANKDREQAPGPPLGVTYSPSDHDQVDCEECVHEQLAIAAQAEGKSINTLAQEALRERVAS